jgi:predicted dehydrogenase
MPYSGAHTTAVRSWVMAKRVRVGIVGCGDVARRRYLPMLASLADRVDLVACGDRSAEALDAAISRSSSPPAASTRSST